MLNRNIPIDIECPGCHKKFSFTLGHLLSRELISCLHCGSKLDTTAAEDIAAEAERPLKDLKKNIIKAIKVDLKA